MSAESVQLYNTFVALLSLVAFAGAIGLIAFRVVRGPGAAESIPNNVAYWMAWAVAATSTLGSLFYSEVIHFPPCELCWFQRIFMYPLSILLLIAAVRREVVAKIYTLPLVLIGLGVSIWHYLIQIYPALSGGACDPSNPCSSRWVEEFGFISIPFMAGAGFIVIAVLLAFYVKAPPNE